MTEDNLEPVPIPFLKRLTDVLLAGVLLILCFPLGFVLSVLIKLTGLFIPEDRGSVFRHETRYSEGRPFQCYKFRVMRQNILNHHQDVRTVGCAKKMERDENCTAVGRLVKKWYLDELPQLYNILRGDMSWVGPRPYPKEDYEDDLRKGRVRKKVIRAGLTGLFQIHKGSQNRRSDCELDGEYIQKCRSLSPTQLWLYDMSILYRTFRVIFEAKGL